MKKFAWQIMHADVTDLDEIISMTGLSIVTSALSKGQLTLISPSIIDWARKSSQSINRKIMRLVLLFPIVTGLLTKNSNSKQELPNVIITITFTLCLYKADKRFTKKLHIPMLLRLKLKPLRQCAREICYNKLKL